MTTLTVILLIFWREMFTLIWETFRFRHMPTTDGVSWKENLRDITETASCWRAPISINPASFPLPGNCHWCSGIRCSKQISWTVIFRNRQLFTARTSVISSVWQLHGGYTKDVNTGRSIKLFSWRTVIRELSDKILKKWADKLETKWFLINAFVFVWINRKISITFKYWFKFRKC